MTTAVPEEGTSSNRYQILGKLAGGGMADIFLARSTSEAGVERYVVLKRVLAERSRDPHFATMFLDEARLAAQLQHPNIAQVHDIGKLAGSYFYTMEYVHGEDLRHVMQRTNALRRPVPLALGLHVAINALAGLHHAHTRTTRDGKPLGVVHRDVSPSNVMVSYEGVIKLLDFGVAKATQRSSESRSGTIKGKIAYLSPEQCRGDAVDRRSDIYSLGIVMFEMLTGKRLYRRDTDFATMMAIVQEPVPSLTALRSDISPALEQIVMTALSKHPDGRYSTAADMIEVIEGLAGREGHVLSATALSRFMRELFGDRPEPWLELKEQDYDRKAITVTGESVAGLDPLVGAVPIAMTQTPSGGHLVAESMLQQQLDAVPSFARSEDPNSRSGSLPANVATPVPGSGSHPRLASSSQPPLPRPDSSTDTTDFPGPDTSPPTLIRDPSYPSQPQIDPRMRQPTPSQPMIPRATTAHVAPPPPASPYPTASPEMMAGLRAPPEPVVESVPFWRRPAFVIGVTAVGIVAAIIVVIQIAGGSGPEKPKAPGVHVEAPAVTPVPTPDDAAVVAEVAADAAPVVEAPPVDAAEAKAVPVDAAVVAPPVDAVVATRPPPPPVEKTIAQLFKAEDWAQVLERCAGSSSLSASDRARCGVAACKTTSKSTAAKYFASATSASQDLIERACKDKGIVLRAAPVHPPPPPPPPPPAKNPCDDKQYREQNPLKCQ